MGYLDRGRDRPREIATSLRSERASARLTRARDSDRYGSRLPCDESGPVMSLCKYPDLESRGKWRGGGGGGVWRAGLPRGEAIFDSFFLRRRFASLVFLGLLFEPSAAQHPPQPCTSVKREKGLLTLDISLPRIALANYLPASSFIACCLVVFSRYFALLKISLEIVSQRDYQRLANHITSRDRTS